MEPHNVQVQILSALQRSVARTPRCLYISLSATRVSAGAEDMNSRLDYRSPVSDPETGAVLVVAQRATCEALNVMLQHPPLQVTDSVILQQTPPSRVTSSVKTTE
jgi:hypothetical protein